jgi:2-oxoglutarate dehydrogenase E2 component (dihydrolipoamide succinyltransferase)
MSTEMLMPQMGESIAEATILKWRKSEGDVVEKDETILEISTDKVDSEIPAPTSGKLVKIIAKEGQTVAVKSVIAIIGEEAAETATSTVATQASQAPQAVAPQVAAVSSTDMPSHVGDKFLSPLVRSIAAQHGLSTNEVSSLTGSGTNGRVTKEDVLGYIEGKTQAPAASVPTPVSLPRYEAPKQETKSEAPKYEAPKQDYDPSGVKVEPFDNMRKLIAEHMVRSKATSPHVYSMAEIDVTNIAKWRNKVQNSFVGREGFKLSFTPFFLEAVVKALQQFPRINASVDGNNLIIKRDINLGCAVALGKEGLDGLIVPVIKNAGQLN